MTNQNGDFGDKSKNEEGNTKPPRKRLNQYKHWCFTLNNYTKLEMEILETHFSSISVKWIMGIEVGEMGTPHIQGFISLKKKKRITELMNINNRIHWENCKGSENQNIQYCLKDNNYKSWGIGKWQLLPPKNNVYIGSDLPKENELFDWQVDIIDIIEQPADNRTIHWLWESKGNCGKTMFCKYLNYHYNALVCQKGKYNDIMNYAFEHEDLTIFIIDVPRSSGNSVSYNAIESIKSGIIVNMKYETGSKLINSPHLIIFANEPPEKSKLSNDRWNIISINNEIWEDELINSNDELN